MSSTASQRKEKLEELYDRAEDLINDIREDREPMKFHNQLLAVSIVTLSSYIVTVMPEYKSVFLQIVARHLDILIELDNKDGLLSKPD